MDDNAVRSTNTDAAECKLSAASAGYLKDSFIAYFVRSFNGGKKQPLINLGTYARTKAIDHIVQAFLAKQASGCTSQILSVGAGFDTRFFCLKDTNPLSSIRYFEIDYEEIVVSKIAVMRKHKLLKYCNNVEYGRGGLDLFSDEYILLSGDLREWNTHVTPTLLKHGFDPQLPTLLLSECVFIYLPVDTTHTILEWATSICTTLLCLSYEQIGPSDSFGMMMLRNLKTRGIELPSIYAYPTLDDQRKRLLNTGFNTAEALDMNELWQQHVQMNEKKRLNNIEFMDEVEEWQLIGKHYCLALGVKCIEESPLRTITMRDLNIC